MEGTHSSCESERVKGVRRSLEGGVVIRNVYSYTGKGGIRTATVRSACLQT